MNNIIIGIFFFIAGYISVDIYLNNFDKETIPWYEKEKM